MVDVVRCQTSHAGHAVPMAEPSRTKLECPWCGPYYRQRSDSNAGACPKCNLTPAEVRYAERIIADSSAVYAEEHRTFQAQRKRGGP